MSLGAIAALVTGQIAPLEAFRSINADVMLFLFGMFVTGEALDRSGYLAHLASGLFGKPRSVALMVPVILFGAGLTSAILMNDTLAILGTPVVLLLARQHNIPAKPLLLSLAFAVTIGSVMSPIGNPQNLLVAINGGVINPFVTFLRYLAVPTFINLAIAWLFLGLYYRRDLAAKLNSHPLEHIRDEHLARLCQISLGIILVMVLMKVLLVFLRVDFDIRLTYIALAGALPILVFSGKRWTVIRRVDWYTLVFFAAMFVLMQSVWNSGVFQRGVSELGIDILSVEMVLTVSVLLSQLISNVPLVALYLPVLSSAGASTDVMMALAAGSTIAGNLTILGAASNVIIIQNAESRGHETLTFYEFSRIGIPLTVANVLVYWVFFVFL